MVSISTDRQQKILELLRERKTLKIQELVEQLKVSPMTVHRDLHRLAKAVVREHAGEIPSGPESLPDLPGAGSSTAGRVHPFDSAAAHAAVAVEQFLAEVAVEDRQRRIPTTLQ